MMKYSTIEDVTLNNGDRVHLQFGFNVETAKAEFALDVTIQSKGKTQRKSADNLYDVLAWLRFNRLSDALFSGPKFTKKYSFEQNKISDHLVVLRINDVPLFYFKNAQGEWNHSERIESVAEALGIKTAQDLEITLGKDFMAAYQSRLNEIKEMERASSILKDEFKTFNTLVESQNKQDEDVA